MSPDFTVKDDLALIQLLDPPRPFGDQGDERFHFRAWLNCFRADEQEFRIDFRGGNSDESATFVRQFRSVDFSPQLS